MNLRRALLLLSILSIAWHAGALGEGGSIFASASSAQTNSPTVSRTVPAFARPHARTPIPLRWKLTVLGGAALVSLAVLAFAAPRWRSWNLFDRQYRFPRVEKVPLRLGATRSGGCIATVDFRAGTPREKL